MPFPNYIFIGTLGVSEWIDSAIGVEVQDQSSIVTIDAEEENDEIGIVLKGITLHLVANELYKFYY